MAPLAHETRIIDRFSDLEAEDRYFTPETRDRCKLLASNANFHGFCRRTSASYRNPPCQHLWDSFSEALVLLINER